jgi:hypothetical protein
MNENDLTNQSLDSHSVEVSKHANKAIWSVVLGTLVPLSWWIIIYILNYIHDFIPILRYSFFEDLMFLLTMFSIIAIPATICIGMLLGFIFGIIAIKEILLEQGQLRGKWRAISAIVLAPIIIFLLFYSMDLSGERVLKKSSIISKNIGICEANILELGKALKKYAAEHGSYPAADKWCNALLEGKYVTKNIFICPGNKRARCSYSVNPKCTPNSPPSEILIFESDGGWNSYGGPELFSIKHHAHYGGYILANDFTYIMWYEYDPNGWPVAEMEGIRALKNKGRDLK